jgi:hypothetical protein
MEKPRGLPKYNLKSWLFPVVISGGMGLGALIGVTGFSNAIGQSGPAGDAAGAVGVLIIGVCLVAGFTMAILTLIVMKIKGCEPKQRLLTGMVLSILGGVIIGGLGSTGGGMATTTSWVILILLPVLLTWSWR